MSCSASSATSCCRSSITQWKDHLYSLDHLKEGIGLRGYGQRDPLVEYKKESFALFQAMKDRVDEEIGPLPLVAASGSRRRGGRDAGSGGRAPRRAPLVLNDPGAAPNATFGVAAGSGAIRRRSRRAPAGARRRSRRASAATTPT